MIFVRTLLPAENISSLVKAEVGNPPCPVFQTPYFFYATLEDNICLGRPISKDVYYDVIRKLNLEYLLERYHNQELTPEIMDSLSGGEQQRVALARAMVGCPSIYLCGYPFNSAEQKYQELRPGALEGGGQSHGG